jgi:hypothetical protein
MTAYPLSREVILTTLRAAFEPLPFIYAMWEGGAASFDRVDEWSDIDLQVDVEDERVDEVMALAGRLLAELSPIELEYAVPQPSWHGHAQTFYWLRDAGPYLLVDFVVMKHSNPTKFLEHEVHGNRLVHFDKVGVTDVGPLDAGEFVGQVRKRWETLRVTFPLFQSLTLKEINRGNAIEAFAFYQGFTVRPLLEAIRMELTPYHYNFHARYVYYELPPEMVRRLEGLFFVASLDDLAEKRRQAEEWFHEVAGRLDEKLLG